MTEIDEKKWGVFAFEEIFCVCKGFYNKKPDASGKGRIPFLGATDSNNGVTSFLTYQEIDSNSKTGDKNNSPIEKKLFPGHAIAVTNNGSVGHAYYQATSFTCSHDINPLYLRDHEMNQNEAYFLIKAIEEQGKLFQYARKWRPIRMVKSKILLPVDDDGNPDYAYMAQYASEMRKQSLTRYKNYIAEQISRLEYKEIPKLGEKEWQAKPIIEMFERLTPGKGKGLNHLNQTERGINYIGATNRNNGVLCTVEDTADSHKLIQPGNCIGFIKNGDGAAGFAIYKKEPFISTSDVVYGYAKWLNLYTGLFFVAAQDMIEKKYSHGYKRNLPHLRGDKVMLPVNGKGDPDYAYMKQYAKNMILKKCHQYLTYLEKQGL